MQFKLSISTLIFIFWGSFLSFAQQTWNLNQCISYAIKNNINLKEYELLGQLSEEDLNQSKRDLLPGLSASTNAGMNFGRSIDPNTNQYITTQFFNNSYNFNTSVAVFDGFRLQNQIKYQKFRKQITEYNQLNAVDDLAFIVMTSYFDVIYFEGMLEIAKEQVETSKLNLKTVERQVDVGLKAKSDVLEMRANLEREELNRIQIENSRKTALLKLKQQMNFVSTDEMILTDSQELVIRETISDPQNLFEQFITWSPYYRSVEANLKATEKSLSLYRGQLYPSIYARGSMNTGFSETNKADNGQVIKFGEQFLNNRSQFLGASLSIPIFNKWAYRSNVKKAKLEIERAKNILEDERQKLFFEMANDLTDLEALYQEYNQYKKRSEVDDLAFKASEKKFEQGLINVIEFYIAKNRLATTNSQVLRARLQWEIKMKTIEFYKGQRFWETDAPSNSPEG
jgi:outer membrane protein